MRITDSGGTVYVISRDKYQYVLQQEVTVQEGETAGTVRLLHPRFYPTTDALFRALLDRELKQAVDQLGSCINLRDFYTRRLTQVYETAKKEHDPC